jgi:hypothetical protein
MKKATVVLEYDENYLDSHGLTLEDEINGWLEDSYIRVMSIEENE